MKMTSYKQKNVFSETYQTFIITSIIKSKLFICLSF